MSRHFLRKSPLHEAHHGGMGSEETSQQQQFVNEVSNLRCKLDSKSNALVILSQDLLECKQERDELKLMAEQLRERYTSLKRRVEGHYHGQGHSAVPNAAFTQILCDLTDQNKRLLYEVDDLRIKHLDAEGDLKILREQLHSMKYRRYGDHYESGGRHSRQDGISDQRMDEIVSQLEVFRSRVTQMERDLQFVLDEKEELVLSRDAYKAKVERLNERLNGIMRGASPKSRRSAIENDQSGRSSKASHSDGTSSLAKIVDIDSLTAENRFLKERVQQLDEEKQLANTSLTKYKTILEKANSKKNLFNSIGLTNKRSDAKDLGGQASEAIAEPHFDASVLASNVVSSRQVQQFIASNSLNNLEVTPNAMAHLRSLVLALFEAFCDKSSALTLHKKNNKLLGKRIAELEDKVKELQAKEKVFLLMKDDNVLPDLNMIERESVDRPDEESIDSGPILLDRPEKDGNESSGESSTSGPDRPGSP